MPKINFSVYKSNVEKYTANAISNYLRKNKDKQILFMVSGGSVLKVLDNIDFTAFGKNITVSLMDERFSRDEKISNFIKLTHTKFYKNAQNCGVKFISSLPQKDENLKNTSQRLEKAFRKWESDHKFNRLIVSIIGIGIDGHTAGIMPFLEDKNKFANLFENEKQWIVGYDAGNKNQYPMRITVNIPFLKNIIDYTFVYVSGEDKRDILKKVIESWEVAKYPASIFNSMKNIELYTNISPMY